TEFKYKNFWKLAVTVLVLYIYGFIEIFVLDISADPMYFMPEGDIQHILGVSYSIYLIIYIIFISIFTNIFFIIEDRKYLKEQYFRLKEELLYKRKSIYKN
ncbi:MAG: hypothetical protein J6R47_03025, partial [Acholeplasmatales bacterium]|nr:hypothetical protein [Acholeplasmatales bacterium]